MLKTNYIIFGFLLLSKFSIQTMESMDWESTKAKSKKRKLEESQEIAAIENLPAEILFSILELAITSGKISNIPENYKTLSHVNKKFKQILTDEAILPQKTNSLRNLIKQVTKLIESFKVDFDSSIDAVGGYFSVTALHWATDQQVNYYELAKFLISKGANANFHDRVKDSCLKNASRIGYLEIVNLLISNGANVNAINEDGVTALMIASLYGHTDVLKTLINKGAAINMKSLMGNSALHFATFDNIKSAEKIISIIQILINNGADVTLRNNDDKTALEMVHQRPNK